MPVVPQLQSNVVPFGAPLIRHVPAPVSSQFAVYVLLPHFLNCEHVTEPSGPPPALPPYVQLTPASLGVASVSIAASMPLPIAASMPPGITSGTAGTNVEKCVVCADTLLAAVLAATSRSYALDPAGAVSTTTLARVAFAGNALESIGSVTVTGARNVCPSGPNVCGTPTAVAFEGEGAFGSLSTLISTSFDSAPAGTTTVVPSSATSVPPAAPIVVVIRVRVDELVFGDSLTGSVRFRGQSDYATTAVFRDLNSSLDVVADGELRQRRVLPRCSEAGPPRAATRRHEKVEAQRPARAIRVVRVRHC